MPDGADGARAGWPRCPGDRRCRWHRGRAIADALAADGATVIVADREEARAEAVAADLAGATAYAIDLAD